MALREPRAAPYRVLPARSEHMEEIARIEEASFLVPWKQEFFESEIAEPYRYARVLVADVKEPPADQLARARTEIAGQFHHHRGGGVPQPGQLRLALLHGAAELCGPFIRGLAFG